VAGFSMTHEAFEVASRGVRPQHNNYALLGIMLYMAYYSMPWAAYFHPKFKA